VSDRDGGFLGTAPTQVLAVGVDEGGPVGGGDAQGLGFGHAGVAFDGVQGQVEAAGAVEQADALAEEIVDLVPAFERGLLAYSGGAGRGGAGRVDGGPASGVGADLELDFVAEISPEVPSVADLHRVGQASAAVGAAARPHNSRATWDICQARRTVRR
jgi:hypothetical protein